MTHSLECGDRKYNFRFITTKLKVCHLRLKPRVRDLSLAVSLSPEPSWLIWSLAPWTVSGQDPTVASSDLTTSCSDSPELATIGPRVTTPRELSWWTVSWMWSGRRLRVVTVSR